MIKQVMNYEDFIVWEIKRDDTYEYWLSNKEKTVMVFSFGSTEKFNTYYLKSLQENGYFNVQEIEIGRF